MKNKSIYEKNMEAIMKVYPMTANYINDKIKAYESNPDAKPVLDDTETFSEKGMFEEIEIISEEGYDGTPVFKVIKDDVQVYLDGKRKPGKIAAVWAEKFDKLPRTSPIIMFGIGNGAFLLEINKKAKEDLWIFIYEPSLKIFIKCIQEVDLSEAIEKRKVVIGLDDSISYKEIKALVSQHMDMAVMEFSRRYVLPGYSKLYPKETKKFMELILKPMRDIIANHATRAQFSNIIAGTILYNSLYLPDCNTTYQLADVIPRDVPAIVVAAGPSLNKNIQELKNAKNKAFIIAVDTALRPLLKENIVPDMFAIVDATKPIELVNVEGAEKIPMITAIASAQEVLAFHTGKKFFYNEGVRYINKPFTECGIDFKNVSSGGSVATIAFSLVYMVGIDTIILVGQDLALTGNKTHADGTFQEKMEEIDTKGMRMVPGYYGEDVPTRQDFYMYLEWYKNYIKGCKEYRSTLRVINATEGGAMIDGAENMTLREAIEENCKKEVDISGLIESVEPVFSGKNRDKVIEYLHGTEAGFRAIAQNAISQKKVYKKIENMTKTGGIGMKEYRALLEKLKKMNKEMLKSPLYQLVDDSLIDARLALEKELLIEEDSILEEAKEIARKGLLYMDLVNECSLLLADVAASSVSFAK